MDDAPRTPWKCLDSKVLLDHPRMTVMEDTVQLPSGHMTSYVRLSHASDAVTIICLREGQLLLQWEYSYPPGERLLQFPGGKIETNETPEQAAARELKEENPGLPFPPANISAGTTTTTAVRSPKCSSFLRRRLRRRKSRAAMRKRTSSRSGFRSAISKR